MSELLNLVGLSTGVALYAMLFAMVIGSGSTRGARTAPDPLLIIAAVLGLIWNLFALPAYELPKVGIAGPFPWVVAIGFCALGFLPAVVVHSVLRAGLRGPIERLKGAIAAVAYAASTVAAVLQMQAVWHGGEVPSAAAMRVLTYTFIALIVPLVFTTKGQPGARRALWVSALAAFAVSALHLTQFHQVEGSWLVELLGHHASVPLAFAILYQDYPFALADLFLKRALALLLLVVTAFVAIVAFSLGSPAFAQFVRLDPRQVGALVTLWVATALVYPMLRRATARFVDSVVLRRPDYRSLRATAASHMQLCDTTPALLDDLCALLAPAMNARSVQWREVQSVESGETSLVTAGEPTIVSIPTVDLPRYALAISQLTGGRRLLSDDVSSLEAIAIGAGRRIDELRITQERYEQAVREQEVAKLASQAELRALRAQINPHFLFNALTTIGYLIQTAPERAFDTLMQLTSLLRGVLRSEGELTTLGRELELVGSYLEIERARFDERLRVRIDVPEPLLDLRLPPLLLQPLVENAIKHGVGILAAGGEVSILASLERGASKTPTLVLTVADTGAGAAPQEFAIKRAQGVGLRNVERRLAVQYGDASTLQVDTAAGRGTRVTIRMPADHAPAFDLVGRAS